MTAFLAFLARIQFKNDRALLAFAALLAVIVGVLVFHHDLDPKVGLAFLAGAYTLPGFFGKKGPDKPSEPPEPPPSGPYRRTLPGIASYEDDEPTHPSIAPHAPTDPKRRERAWLRPLPAAAAILLIGSSIAGAFVYLTGCGAAARAAATEAEGAYREEMTACVRQYETTAQIIACREKVADSWGVVYVPTAFDGGVK